MRLTGAEGEGQSLCYVCILRGSPSIWCLESTAQESDPLQEAPSKVENMGNRKITLNHRKIKEINKFESLSRNKQQQLDSKGSVEGGASHPGGPEEVRNS